MDIRKLQRAIVDGLEDVKAQHIVVFNTEHLSALFERVIIASGTSNRQTKSLASSVRDAVKTAGFPVLSTEGSDNGEWIIVDCGAAVAHIMQPTIRDYYRLEEIWGGKPVKMKIGDDKQKPLPKASADDNSTPSKGGKPGAAKAAVPAKKAAPAKKGSATRKPASAQRPGAGKAAAPAAKKVVRRAAPVSPAAPAKRPAAKRSGATKSVATRSGAARTGAARSGATKSAAPRSAPPRTAAPTAKKAAPARRPAAKRPAAKKSGSGR